MRRPLLLLALSLVAGCGGPPATKVAPAPTPAAPQASAAPVGGTAPDVPLAPIRTGTIAAVTDADVEMTVTRRFTEGGYEYFELTPANEQKTLATYMGPFEIALSAPQVGVAAQAVFEPGKAPVNFANRARPLIVRRRTAAAPITGTIFTPAMDADYDGHPAPGHKIPFHGTPTADTKLDPTLAKVFVSSLADDLSHGPGAFYAFASERLRELPGAPKHAIPTYGPDTARHELASLMDTTTGRRSVELALQRDRPLLVGLRKEKPSIDVAKVQAPDLGRHPWADLLRALRVTPPLEPLAAATPADFYFARARDVSTLLDVLDVVEDWGQPAAAMLDRRTEDRGTFDRYQTELCLPRTGLSRTLGPELVQEIALVGSDPYVHEGTDVTLLLRPKNGALLEAALSALLAAAAPAHGGVTSKTFVHEGTTVTSTRSGDGKIRQVRASTSGLVVVSNSEGAIRRVLSAIAGKVPRLSDEADFQYMLARDATRKDDVLAYLGDRFVASVVSPKQKIAEARRLVALSELAVPGYAALLGGHFDGEAPKDAASLLSRRLLRPEDLRHADGAPITFEPGHAAQSKWGSVDRAESLIDLPEVTKVTKTEADAYAAFANSYTFAWSDKIDPIALRVTKTMTGPNTNLSLDLRVLPLLRREYRDVQEMAGDARVDAPPLLDGLRAVIGIGKEAEVRGLLTHETHSIGLTRLSFDWLGDFAFLGVANENRIANLGHRELSRDLDAPVPREEEQTRHEPLSELPVYAGIEIKSRAGAALVLTALRERSRELVGSSLKWGDAPKYRNADIVSLTLDEKKGEPVTLYYSLLSNAFVIALKESALHAAIDQMTDGAPRVNESAGPARAGAQLLLDAAGRLGSPLHTLASWAFTAELGKSADSLGLAEPILRGAPETRAAEDRFRELARAYFGVVPLTPEGTLYAFGPEGIRDPIRGVANEPVWPAYPVPGSLVDRVVSRLASVRSELSFDQEPKLGPERPFQSLHARVTVQVAPKR